MKVKLTPENAADRRWLRERAEQGGRTGIDFELPAALTRAAEKWVAKHPQKPGPGSLLRRSGSGLGQGALRMVRSDGKLIAVSGAVVNGPDWDPADYTLVLEMYGE